MIAHAGRYSIAGMILVCAIAGCQTTGNKAHRAQAEARWNAVRADVKLQLATKQFRGGLFEEAQKTATEAVADDPTCAQAYVLLAQTHMEQGHSGDARRVINLARQAGVASAGLDYTDGVLLEQRGMLQEAAVAYARALEADVAEVDYLVAYVECQVSAGHADQAQQVLQERAGRFSDGPTIPLLAGHLAAAMGRVEDATRHYQQAYVRASDDAMVAETLGLWLARARHNHEAIAVLEPIVGCGDDGDLPSTARLALASCYLAVDQPAMAKRTIEDCALAHPDHWRAQMLLGKAAVVTGDWMLARRAVHRLRQMRPHDPEAGLLLATVLYAEKRYVDAVDLLHDLMAGGRDDVDLHCLMAESLAAMGEHNGAIRQFEEALSLNQRCAWAKAGLADLNRRGPSPPKQDQPRITREANATQTRNISRRGGR